MQTHVLKGRWKQVRGKAKQEWGKLTDDDLDRIAGQWDRLVGMLQEKYGYSREQVEEQVEKFLSQFDDGHAAPETGLRQVPAKVRETAEALLERVEGPDAARQRAEMLREQAKEVPDQVRQRASDVPAMAKDYPWQTVALILALSIILILVLKQRR